MYNHALKSFHTLDIFFVFFCLQASSALAITWAQRLMKMRERESELSEENNEKAEKVKETGLRCFSWRVSLSRMNDLLS